MYSDCEFDKDSTLVVLLLSYHTKYILLRSPSAIGMGKPSRISLSCLLKTKTMCFNFVAVEV